MRELEAQAKALAPVLSGFVNQAIAALRGDIDKSLDARLETLRGEQSKAVAAIAIPTTEDVARVVVEMLPAPAPGKDADPEAIKSMVAEEVAKIPRPRDGESVTVEELAPIIAEQVRAAVDQLPKPKDGESVPLEEVQRMVSEEVAKAMQAITLPSDGEPGRDALQLEILPEIDTSKSYPRGTYAKHDGGLWRAFERTHALKGWECIVDGLASAEVEQDGDRAFKAVLRMSSGAVTEKALQIPAMVYRGVFVPGEYQPGDTATWGGSLWHCDEPTSDKPGEPGSKGWRLAVKKGRDGKDGLDGKDLTKGVSIK